MSTSDWRLLTDNLYRGDRGYVVRGLLSGWWYHPTAGGSLGERLGPFATAEEAFAWAERPVDPRPPMEAGAVVACFAPDTETQEPHG